MKQTICDSGNCDLRLVLPGGLGTPGVILLLDGLLLLLVRLLQQLGIIKIHDAQLQSKPLPRFLSPAVIQSGELICQIALQPVCSA
ncbi:hypothetical protein D3C80_1986120 [compost metagenome]